jgi:hypothetical protein
VPTDSATEVTLRRSAGLNHVLAAAVSILLGLFGIVWVASGHGGVLVGVLAGVLLALGALLAWGIRAATDRLVFDDDAVSRSIGPRQLWRLRWQHMAAVRFGSTRWDDPDVEQDGRRDALWLVPLAALIGHPEIAPALESRPIDGVLQPTFEVALGLNRKVWDGVRAAVERHAPPQLLPDAPPD